MTENKDEYIFLFSLEFVELLLEIILTIFNEKGIVEDIPPLNNITRKNVVSICNTVYGEVFGQPLYPTLELQAAYIFYSFIKNHPLTNGNKRMAVICSTGYIFANVNGFDNPARFPEAYSTLFFYELAIQVESMERTHNVDHKFVLTYLEEQFQKFIIAIKH
jgi:prophage maintenance system killer protein